MLGVGEEVRHQRLEENASKRGWVGTGFGVAVGCFAGMSYGKTVGMGRFVSKDTVAPSRSRFFMHYGSIRGAFCGATIGGGVGTFLGSGIYKRWHLHLPKSIDARRRLSGMPRTPKIIKKAISNTPIIIDSAYEKMGLLVVYGYGVGKRLVAARLSRIPRYIYRHLRRREA